MKIYEIKNATAIYTGGGIYIYYGKLENGLYFRTADFWKCISICDADTSKDDADYDEFYERHEIDELLFNDYENFFNDILLWIIQNKPDGNYNITELEHRIIAPIETNVEIENAQTLAKTIQERVKQEKFEQLLSYQLESIKRCMSEYRTDCNFFFADGSQYRRDFEKQWRDEFYNNAVRLFENNGYKIVKQNNYTLIKW